jgi:regulatory protein
VIVTKISPQVKDPNRLNIFLDGTYTFSLNLSQVVDLGVRIGREYSEQEIEDLRQSSDFGKLYSRALEYSLVRPRSLREVEQYLFKKTLNRMTKEGNLKSGYSKQTASKVLESLVEKGYVDDEKFAVFWVENRHLKKGISSRKLRAELLSKGVSSGVIDAVLAVSDRQDSEELSKVIAKKAHRYSDRQKLIAYLAGRGFSYDDITEALSQVLSDESP